MRRIKVGIQAGQTYHVRYPFIRDEIDAWKPGCQAGTGYADAEGQMVLTVVSVHKPGKYPERVFYTRSWIDPAGGCFGKRGLRMTTTEAFKRLASGYRHPYELRSAANTLPCDEED